jgi:hypothetical protein
MSRREPQRDLFDLREGRRQRDVGMDRAAQGRLIVLEKARAACRRAALARSTRYATIDDAGALVAALGNAAGLVFRGAEWQATPHWWPSVRVSNHARQVRVWRLAAE